MICIIHCPSPDFANLVPQDPFYPWALWIAHCGACICQLVLLGIRTRNASNIMPGPLERGQSNPKD
ncbi:hypothetical protein P691DRAFT_811393 [Macrolepiota fuliginosa MF-IS2]|uniref:Uncharacterized protein n=1 Tax=Macrolepiota fuliginosa MF-IS2 TaxID=1400762 RepID=A0A9P5XIR0_9AGAR|nr:hypothetical protein P691DRAFT_811393 [Macrolepiota fuliginosa MF-IS2]